MSTRLPLDVITEQPWALLRSTLQLVVDTASSGAHAQALTRGPVQPRRDGVIAVLPIQGVIEHRASLLGEMFGGTSIEAIRASLTTALADPDVAAIVLDVDSPGGGVIGVTELAAEIRKAREQKPIVAVTNGMAASAAYWLASQAERVYATPSGQVGSIGIYAVHQDMSKAMEAEGITATIISAGEHKVEGNEFQPLSDDARGDMQRRVDAYYEQFVGDVAKGRRTSTATVLADYGGGRTMLAAEAMEAGLVDEVGTLDDAVRQVARSMRGSALRAESDGPIEALPFGPRVHAQASDLAALVAHARTRADLRGREHRPAFSVDIEVALRSIRDDAVALSALLPADPAPVAAATVPVVEPPAPVAPITPRFRSRGDWMAYLEARAHR